MDNKKYRLYNQKVYDLGKSYEIHLQDVMTSYLIEGKEERKYEEKKFRSEEEYELYLLEKEKKREAYYHEKARDLRRTVELNRTDRTKFYTLTFDDEHDYSIEDVKVANKHFKNFISKINYYLNKNNTENKKRTIKYIATWELTKKGRIHYHVIFFNLPFIKKDKLVSMWGGGFVHVKSISKGDMADTFVALYLVKYLVKDISTKAKFSKSILSSNNLRKPEPYREIYDLGFYKDEREELKKIAKFMRDKNCNEYKTIDYRRTKSKNHSEPVYTKTKLVLNISKEEYDNFVKENNLKELKFWTLPSYVTKKRQE